MTAFTDTAESSLISADAPAGGLRVRSGTPDAADTRIVEVDGRPVVRFAVGDDLRLETLSAASSDSLAAACRLALDKRHPLVAWISSAGPNVHEGIASAHSWGRAAKAMVECSGIVPVILVLDGPAVTGSALLLGIADFVVMVDRSYAFVTGPRMVEEFTGIPVSHDELGGSITHHQTTGVAAFGAATPADAEDVVADLLSYLPAHTDELGPRLPIDPSATAGSPTLNPALDQIIPAEATTSYDVRDIIGEVVDENTFFEAHARWASNLVIGFARVDGRSVGIVANQPQSLAGTLNIEASQKGARFVSFCDAFNLALVTLVDTPGFQPGKDLEWRGMIRHGAELAFAYARATVPRISVTVRKSYGGAYIVMDSKHMGNDVAFAWPCAEIAVMGAKGAVEILHRRADATERADRIEDYEQRLLNPWRAAERGSIDAVIEPSMTRFHVAHALAVLESKAERLPHRRHDNTPL